MNFTWEIVSRTGQVIAREKSTGRAFESHLHKEVLRRAVSADDKAPEYATHGRTREQLIAIAMVSKSAQDFIRRVDGEGEYDRWLPRPDGPSPMIMSG